MKTKFIHLSLLAIIIGFSACGSKEEKQVGTQNQSLEVSVLKVKEVTTNNKIKISGIVQASQQANISSRMMGVVEQINAGVGEQVKAGQLIISLRSSDLEAQKAKANAMQAAAESNFSTVADNLKRAENLFAKESISLQELEGMQNNFNAAKANLEASKQMQSEIEANLSYAKIMAPFDGEIVNQFIEIGDMASPGQTLLAIEQSTIFEVHAGIPERYIAELMEDSLVEVKIKSIGQQINGKLVELSRSSKNTGGQFMVKVQLAPSANTIYSGMFAELSLPLKQSDDFEKTIYIPENVLIKNGSLSGVYTLSESNTAVLRWLRLGEKVGNQFEVLSGLIGGEEVILNSSDKLYNGASVSIIQ
tara:strand:- start:2127 stop:3212 length:1086 start_codon:yes stop_codon:yes gene_type:complete